MSLRLLPLSLICVAIGACGGDAPPPVKPGEQDAGSPLPHDAEAPAETDGATWLPALDAGSGFDGSMTEDASASHLDGAAEEVDAAAHELDSGASDASTSDAGDANADADDAGPDAALEDAGCDPEVVVNPNLNNTTEATGQGSCPAGMAPVSTFCVDVYEASLVAVSDGAAWSPYLSPGATPMRAVSVAGAVPQGYINGTQAAAACANAGKRLCTDAEWLRACRGPQTYTYPYGNSRIVGACNDQRAVHPAVAYFGSTEPWIYSELGNACLNQLPSSLAAAGAFTHCVSAEGLFDLMGNLHEWTANPSGTFRGGYYVDTALNGDGCLYATTAHDSSHWDYGTGFRCCSDPP